MSNFVISVTPCQNYLSIVLKLVKIFFVFHTCDQFFEKDSKRVSEVILSRFVIKTALQII